MALEGIVRGVIRASGGTSQLFFQRHFRALQPRSCRHAPRIREEEGIAMAITKLREAPARDKSENT